MPNNHSSTKLIQLKAKQQQLQEKLDQKLRQLGGCGGMGRMPADRLEIENTINVLESRLKSLQAEIEQIKESLDETS